MRDLFLMFYVFAWILGVFGGRPIFADEAPYTESTQFTKRCSSLISALAAAKRFDRQTARFLLNADRLNRGVVAARIVSSGLDPETEAQLLGYQTPLISEFPIPLSDLATEVSAFTIAGVPRERLIMAMLRDPSILRVWMPSDSSGSQINDYLASMRGLLPLVDNSLSSISAYDIAKVRGIERIPSNWFKYFMEADPNPNSSELVVVSGVFLDPGSFGGRVSSPLNRIRVGGFPGSRNLQRAAFARRPSPSFYYLNYFSLVGKRDHIQGFFGNFSEAELKRTFLSNAFNEGLKFTGPWIEFPMPKGFEPTDLLTYAKVFGVSDQIKKVDQAQGSLKKVDVWKITLPLANAFMRSLSRGIQEIGLAGDLENAWDHFLYPPKPTK